MSDKYISSMHIKKLGHQIHEIRVRALRNIISKLKHGFIYDNDLARSKELFLKLLEWFTFEPLSNEEDALSLIKGIFESKDGVILVKHFGADQIISQLKNLKAIVHLNFYKYIDEIIEHIIALEKNKENENAMDVPPLISSVPLSYRSESDFTKRNLDTPSTITSIRDVIFEEIAANRNKDYMQQQNSPTDQDSQISVEKSLKPPLLYLHWLPLVSSDKHVLASVEESLEDPTDASVLLHTCDFFKDVMLQDFPPEVFLQRPTIVTLFLNYLKSTSSSRFQIGVLNCLNKLMSSLITRIQFFKDPSTFNLKNNVLISKSAVSTPERNLSNTSYCYMDNVRTHSVNSSSEDDYEKEANSLKNNQIKVPAFACSVLIVSFNFFQKISQELEEGKPMNYAKIYHTFTLTNRAITVLNMCLSSQVWLQRQVQNISELLCNMNDTLVKCGDVLEYVRINVISNEEETVQRLIYLHLLCSCIRMLDTLIPQNELELIVPISLKTALANSLSDALFTQLYPKVHSVILDYVEKFQEILKTDSARKYKDVQCVLQSVTASVKFLRYHKELEIITSIYLADESIPSLGFHRNFNFIKNIIHLLSERLYFENVNEELNKKAEGIVLKLLAHNDKQIQEETYKTCHKVVTTAVGPTFKSLSGTVLGSQIAFLLTSEILIEMAVFGVTNNNKEIRKYAEEILIYGLKCKLLVADKVWNKVVEAFIGSLPILVCHINKKTALGRTILGILDPDTAQSMNIPKIEVLRGNIAILYLNDSLIREEAISRLYWLLSSQTKSVDMLPRISTLTDSEINSICQVEQTYNVNLFGEIKQYYQPNSLVQVLELLSTQDIEPAIKRSALTQTSVMLEDPTLHVTFLEQNGLNIILKVVDGALTENDYKNYPDSVIPAISILKNICLFNSRVRYELKNDINVYFKVLRGLLLFRSEERLCIDASILLFLLVYSDHLLGSPRDRDFSIPSFVFEKSKVPFNCNKHWKTSRHALEDMITKLLTDKWSLSSVRIHWNIEWYGGVKNILNWKEIPVPLEFNEILKLNNSDFAALKNSSLENFIKMILISIQNNNSHQNIINDINLLICSLILYTTEGDLLEFNIEEFLILPWESTFSHFLNIPPANGEDSILLTSVLKCLRILLHFYKNTEDCCAVTILKDETHYLPNLLQSASEEPHLRILHQELLSLITVCVCKENSSVVKMKANLDKDTHSKSWNYIIKIITENLRMSESQHFYNLAYLDYQLSCLVHLTGCVDWKNNKTYSKESIINLVQVLLELITAFHEGKGPSAAMSFMGTGVIRHSVLILNHLLVELQSQSIKGWETYYLGDDCNTEKNFLKRLYSLHECRDVLLRAAALQLLAGLSLIPRAANEMCKEFWDSHKTSVWQKMLSVLMDHEEAAIVREGAGNLLSNLVSHMTTSNLNNGLVLIDFSQTVVKKKSNIIKDVLLLLEEFQFFKEVRHLLIFTIEENSSEKALCAGFFKSNRESQCISIHLNSETNGCSAKSWNINYEETVSISATPGLIQYLASFIRNLLSFTPEEIALHLQQFGLLQLFFRCLCSPLLEINANKDLIFYSELMEMNISICSLLTKAIETSQGCLFSLIHCKDCLHFLLSLLNTSVYYTFPPQLLYLRNQLWVEIFTLLKALLSGSQRSNSKKELNSPKTNGDYNSEYNTAILENLHQVINSLLVENSTQDFLQTVYEALTGDNYSDLQNSSLTVLTALLQAEVVSESSSDVSSKVLSQQSSSWGNLLDSIKTPRSSYNEDTLNLDLEDIKSIKQKPSGIGSDNIGKQNNVRQYEKQKQNILHDVYFDEVPDEISLYRSPSEKQNQKISDGVSSEIVVAGSELCRILIHLYYVSSIEKKTVQKKLNITQSLTNLLCVSQEAKRKAMESGFLQLIIYHLRELHIKLSLESVECIRRITTKKKVTPVLKEVEVLIGLLTNFMHGSCEVKNLASRLALADLMHKLWIWFNAQKNLLVIALKMLCTFTTNCEEAIHSLPFTSSVAGSGPRKCQSNVSLLHEIFSLITKEMEQISRTHDLMILTLCLHLLQNCCSVIECRQIMVKSHLFQCISRLHPALTKGQKPWESVEYLWLEFLHNFTMYPEGQSSLTKADEAFATIMAIACSTRSMNSYQALLVLQNVAFLPLNRPRLLNSSEFLNILRDKLSYGSVEDKNIITIIIWALSANNQRGKLILKCSGLDLLLKDSIKKISFSSECDIYSKCLSQMKYVYSILKEV